jgi:hypothetical protein
MKQLVEEYHYFEEALLIQAVKLVGQHQQAVMKKLPEEVMHQVVASRAPLEQLEEAKNPGATTHRSEEVTRRVPLEVVS